MCNVAPTANVYAPHTDPNAERIWQLLQQFAMPTWQSDAPPHMGQRCLTASDLLLGLTTYVRGYKAPELTAGLEHCKRQYLDAVRFDIGRILVADMESWGNLIWDKFVDYARDADRGGLRSAIAKHCLKNIVQHAEPQAPGLEPGAMELAIARVHANKIPTGSGFEEYPRVNLMIQRYLAAEAVSAPGALEVPKHSGIVDVLVADFGYCRICGHAAVNALRADLQRSRTGRF